MRTYFDLEVMVSSHQERLAQEAANERLAREACSGVPSKDMRRLPRGLLGALRSLRGRRTASHALGLLAPGDPTRRPPAGTPAAKQHRTYSVASAVGHGPAAAGADTVRCIAPGEAA
jgi:hypothetical protein